MLRPNMKVYAVYKEGVKTFYKYREVFRRLGFTELDGIIDYTWQRNMFAPEVIPLRRPIDPGDKVLLVDSSSVSGETFLRIMKRIPHVNFVTVAEYADYYGAFYVDYVVSNNEIKMVKDVTEKYVDLGDERKEFKFGPDDFMVLDRDEKIDKRIRVVESYEKGKPIIFQQNPVYIILKAWHILHKRPKMVADAIGYDEIGGAGRYFAYEEFKKKWNPSLVRVVYRAMAKNTASIAESPALYLGLTYVGNVPVYIPIGFSPVYPAFYKLRLPAYIKKMNIPLTESDILDSEKLLGEASDI